VTADQKDILLGRKITLFRKKMNWPLKTLAADLNVSIQQLQRYEKGLNKISAIMLYQLAGIFKVGVNCFFDEFEECLSSEENTFRVLLIEDSPRDEFLLRRALADFPKKVHVYTINDGKEVLNFFNDLCQEAVNVLPKPDLILLDLNIPSIRGLDILRDIKKRVQLCEIPVVILSSSVSDDDRSSAYSLQASGFIRKSFVYKEFKNQLFQALTYWMDIVELPHYSRRTVHH
jgi:CheY-like chemotaxis protein